MIVTTAKDMVQMTSSHILRFYELYIIPSLKNDKKKLTYVGSAVAATLLYALYRKIALPPVGIRSIPRVNFFTYIASMLRGDDPLYQLKHLYSPLMAQTNGMYVRPNRVGWSVYVSNPVDIKKVFLKADLFPKDSQSLGEGDTLLKGMIRQPSILMSVGDIWKPHRKAANPAFHRAMPVELFGKLVRQVFTEMEKENGTMNITDYIERFGFDAITAAGFGYNANAIGDKNSEWVNYYTSLLNGAFNPFFFLFPIFDNKLRWLFPSRVRLHQTLKSFLASVEEIIIEKRKVIASQGGINNMDDAEKDLCTLMIEAEVDEGGPLTNEELLNDVLTFIIAGHDTTANAIGSAMYYLATHKEIQQTLREEVIQCLGDSPYDVIPTIEQTKSMSYLSMIIKETLRIRGPAVWGQPRIATEDTELGGVAIPKGTLVTPDMMALQHDGNIWENPETFDPERFSPDNENIKRTNNGWLPFGGGQHQCVGMNMSLAEQRVFLSMMVRKYVWTLPKDSTHKNGMVINGMDVVGPKELIIDFTKRY